MKQRFLEAWMEAWNRLPRRVEGDGRIRWFRDDTLVCEVSTQDYYGDGHVHPEDCACSALIHDEHVDGMPKSRIIHGM